MRLRLELLLVLALAGLAAGCSTLDHIPGLAAKPLNAPPPDPLITKGMLFPERLEQGYTVYLPGIFGTSGYGVVHGLKLADVPSAIEFHNWTMGPLLAPYNLRALEHNRREATKIAAKIVTYQQRYPGRPVHVIGYSGGGSEAVLVLEALPPGSRVTSAVLIGACLAMNYDLRTAMSHTEQGIHNFYSYLDVPTLTTVCIVAGTSDGKHTIPGGLVGFYPPSKLDAAERVSYKQGLHQQAFEPGMLLDCHWGGHFGWMSPLVLTRRIAPLIGSTEKGPKQPEVVKAPEPTPPIGSAEKGPKQSEVVKASESTPLQTALQIPVSGAAQR